MDKICDAFIGPSVKAKYSKNYKPPKTKPKPPQKFFNSNIITAKPLPFIEPTKKTKATVKKDIARRPPKSSKRKKSDVQKLFESVGKVIQSVQNEISPKTSKKKNKRPKETPRSSSFSNSSRPKSSRSKSSRTSSSRKGGFIVVSDPERRRKLRSYWMRAG